MNLLCICVSFYYLLKKTMFLFQESRSPALISNKNDYPLYRRLSPRLIPCKNLGIDGQTLLFHSPIFLALLLCLRITTFIGSTMYNLYSPILQLRLPVPWGISKNDFSDYLVNVLKAKWTTECPTAQPSLASKLHVLNSKIFLLIPLFLIP